MLTGNNTAASGLSRCLMIWLEAATICQRMRRTPLIFAALLLGAGCAKHLARPVAAPTAGPVIEPVIKTVGQEPGRITQVNAKYRFVVVDFGRRILPAPGTRLVGYRRDQPVATLRLAESSHGRFAVADILDGDPRLGDEVQAP